VDKIGRQVCLLVVVSLGKAINEIASYTLVVRNRWQLDSKTEKVISLSPGCGTLTNK